MNSLRRGTGIQYMPPKPQRKPANKQKQQQRPKAPNVDKSRVLALEKKIAKMSMQQPRPSGLSPVGKAVVAGGNMLGSMFGVPTIMGSGAYSISENSLVNTSSSSSQVPVIHSSSESVVFRHREFLADVSASSVYNTTTYSINPGLASTFPYLSAIAQNFQEYHFTGLILEFKSTSADSIASGTNTAMGTVGMCAQYRADASTPATKQLALDEYWSVDTKPNANCILAFECSPKESPMPIQYVRTGNVPVGSDPKTYDLCNATVFTSGFQSTTTNIVGELWWSYEVVLYKPVIPNPGSAVSRSYSGSIKYSGVQQLTTYSFASSDTRMITWINGGGGSIGYKLPPGLQGVLLVQWQRKTCGTQTTPGTFGASIGLLPRSHFVSNYVNGGNQLGQFFYNIVGPEPLEFVITTDSISGSDTEIGEINFIIVDQYVVDQSA